MEFDLRYRKIFPLISKIRTSHVQPQTTPLLVKEDKVRLTPLMGCLPAVEEFCNPTLKFGAVIQ